MQPAEVLGDQQRIQLVSRDLRPWLPIAVVLVALVILSFVLPSYLVFIACNIPINALILRSVGLVSGQVGVLSLGQLGFAGVGAWVTVWMVVNVPGLPAPLAMLAGALVAVPFGALVALPALRLRGVNLAVVTLAFASAISVFLSVNGFPGGLSSAFIARPSWASSERDFFLFVLTVAVLVLGATEWLSQRPIGSAWLAVRYSERAAASLGLNVPWIKLSAFMVSSFLAGLAGALLVFQQGSPSVQSFDVFPSLVQFALATFIGTQFFDSAIMAGVFGTVIPEILARFGLPQEIGAVLFSLGAIQALKGGMSITENARREREHKRLEALGTSITVPLTAVNLQPVPTAASVNTKPALEVEHLSVTYGAVRALSDVSFSVLQGSVTALIGPNGAGKSTLVDAVTGFLAGHAGSVKLEGQSLERFAPDARARLGVRRSFQQDRCVPDLRVRDYLHLAAGRKLEMLELETALQFCGIVRSDVFVYSVDVATRRLLEVAGALSARPKVVLLDEPAAGLSASESLVLARRIREIPQRYGCAVLLIEHDMDVVRSACSRAVVLDFGVVLLEGDCHEVLNDPRVARAYLGEEVNA
jgi:branched-chain amino acid transport system permease protein